MSKQKKQAKILKGILVTALVLLALELGWLLFAFLGSDRPTDNDTPTTGETAQREDTQATETSETEGTGMPWELAGAKQPEEYTWEEFETLTVAQQMAFQDYLGLEAFEAWLARVQERPEVNPWDEPGAKLPVDYTWEEFESLTVAQQMAFQDYLGLEAFEAWLTRVQERLEVNPWDEPGAKQPENYTWAEFEELTVAQQIAFQDYLGAKGFSDWLERVQPDDQPETNPWEKSGAKQPEDYTWTEFEALTAQQQMAFQDYLGAKGFSAWLERAQPDDQPETNPWEKPGAKQPEDYTWEEFEALTDPQQMAFQDYLGEEGFEAWMNRVLG